MIYYLEMDIYWLDVIWGEYYREGVFLENTNAKRYINNSVLILCLLVALTYVLFFHPLKVISAYVISEKKESIGSNYYVYFLYQNDHLQKTKLKVTQSEWNLIDERTEYFIVFERKFFRKPYLVNIKALKPEISG